MHLLTHGKIDGRYNNRVGSRIPPILPLEKTKRGGSPSHELLLQPFKGYFV
jgi:hypothetical protein